MAMSTKEVRTVVLVVAGVAVCGVIGYFAVKAATSGVVETITGAVTTATRDAAAAARAAISSPPVVTAGAPQNNAGTTAPNAEPPKVSS